MQTMLFNRILYLSVSILAISNVYPAYANNDHSGSSKDPTISRPDTLEEQSQQGGGDIVITALKRQGTVQSTPISITAMTGDSLAAMGATQLQDYFRQVPNVNVAQGVLGQNRVSVRGIGGIGEATTGLYFGEVPVTGPSGTVGDPGNNAPDLNLYDIERVEVLRGPQGTLYGASSMAGTLRVIFNKPQLSRFEAGGEGQYATTAGGSDSYFAKAMLNIPVISDVLAVRLSGYYEKRPGYIDNVRLGRNNINDSTAQGIRVLVGFEPDPDTSVTGTFIYQRSDADDAQGWFPSVGKFKTNTPVILPFNNRFKLYNLTGTHDFGGVTLTGSGAIYRYDVLRTLDFTPSVTALSYSPAACQGYYAQSTPCSGAQYAAYNAYGLGRTPALGYQPGYLRTETAELRLASDGKGWLQWTAGAFYERRRDYIDSHVTKAGPDGAAPDPLQDISYRYIANRLRQLAGFAEMSVKPVAALTLTGGLRYYDYEKVTAGEALLGSVLTSSIVSPYAEHKATTNGWLVKLNASYDVSSRIMAYANASQGYRPGGANNIPSLQDNLVTYAPDSLWNYEAGVKSRWFGNALTVNAALFQIDWQNIQVAARTADGLFTFLANAGGARIRGAELELSAEPIRGLNLTAALGYVKGELTSDQVIANFQNASAGGKKGDRLGMAPWSAAASASYDWQLTSRLDAMVRADMTYTGKGRTGFNPADPYFTTQGDFATLNLRAGVQNKRVGAFLFVQNVGNVNGVASRVSTFGSTNLSFSIPPRTSGVNIRLNY
jgi:outer membrane receptor protein involved in Fe transport